MPAPFYQQKIGTFCLLGALAVFVLLVMQTETGVKFPTTGPNELLFLDTGLACLIAYYCSCYFIVQHHVKIFLLTLCRVMIFCYVALSMYTIQEWYRSHNSALVAVICWSVFGFQTLTSALSIIWTVYFFYTEELYTNYNWRSIKRFFVGETYRVSPPDYSEAEHDSSLPPTYDEALASRPPGYTAITTPSVSHSSSRSDTSVVRINSNLDMASVRFTRVEMESDGEDEDEESARE